MWQGRFKAFPIEDDAHLLSVMRYVERNPLRAELVEQAEQWPWGSLHRRTQGDAEAQALLAEPPIALGQGWTEHVNQVETEAELAALRRSVARGRPFGGKAWSTKIAKQLGLEHTYRPRGRPRKVEPKQ